MSDIKHQQSKISSRHLFEDQVDLTLQVIQKSPSEINEINVFDYLHDYVNKLETKDSGIYLSSSNIELQLKSTHTQKNNDYKNNNEVDSIKIENISLQNISNSQNELRLKCTEQNHLKMKNESVTHLNEKNTDKLIKINNAVDTEDVKSDNIPIKIKKTFIFEKNIFAQMKDKSHNLEVKNENLNDENNDPETKFSASTSQSKKINSLVMLNKQVKTCSQCSMTFRYKRHLDRHLEGHQKNNCSHCNAKFARRKHLDIHLFRSHGERVTKHPHSCDVCSRSFPKRILLNRHRAKHNYENGKVCSDCGEMLKAEEDDKEHKENHCTKKQFKCKRCLQTFSIEQTYIAHIQNHDNHKCSKCDVTFASKKKVHEHYKMVHSSKLNHNKISNNGIYFCADCRHTFLRKDDYSRHLDSTSHLNKRALDQHVRRIHKEEKKFTCNIYGCTFQCARKSDLDRHKQLHVEQRNIVCEQCGKTFTSQYRPFACMQCSTAFKRSHHLSRHMETCHRITLERKKKVVKLMKTEDGHLVPIPEKPKPLKPKKLKIKTGPNVLLSSDEKIPSSQDMDINNKHSDSYLGTQILLSNDLCENSSLPLESTNLFSNPDFTSQVLSLVDINSEQIVTVEVTSPKTLIMNDLIDQFETNCNEILNLTNYQDLELQHGILNTDQNLYDHTNYSELSLGTVEETSFVDSNINKIDTLPIENYLNQSFSSFLNF
ncbi:hypothetical protein QLX08_009188 [Tetragonisca angustula]|uniref:C2H2-type domain-containing protein n=1 Tax=Tetragonisca angustula TaxID=166442 RepID=A0AAW0ZHR3_9HYME